MKPQNKATNNQKQDKKIVTPQLIKELSVVFRIGDFAKNKQFVIDTLSRIRPENLSKLEIFIVSKSEISTEQFSEIQSISPNINITKYNSGEVFNPTYNHCAIIDSDLFVKPLNINELLAVKGIVDRVSSKILFNGGGKIRPSKKGLWILSKDAASYIVGSSINTDSIDYFIVKQKLESNEIIVNQANPFEKKSFVNIFKKSFCNFINWYLIHPINELMGKVKFSDTYKFDRESSIYRLLFFVIAAALLIIMPVLSRDAGISGDEKVNYDHAKLVYDYYAKGDKSAVDVNVNPNLQKTMLNYYGQSFDNITYIVNKITGTTHPYESRHAMNSMIGWLIILVSGLFLSHIMGWRAAILGMIFLFVSPRFLGHSYNNPKDIPFAFTFVFTIFHVTLLIKEMPKYKIKRLIYIILGIAMAISVRVGGIMLMAYLFLFVGIAYTIKYNSKDYFSSKFLGGGFKIIALLGLLCILAFYIGLILWPYAIESPIKNTKESLNIMTNFSVGLRQLFEGNNMWSDRAPWFYLPRYIFMTIPILVIIGAALSLILSKQITKKVSGIVVFILVFSCVFPIWYIIYKKSNVYGGWRHVMFVYPFLVILASLGFEAGLRLLKNKYAQLAGMAVIGVLVFLPLKHIAKNHPHEYVYYNEISGGIKKAYGHYEMDYYYHSMRAASLWVKEHVKNETKPDGKKIIVGSNNLGITEYYLKEDSAKINLEYIRYYERGNIDWDYYIVVNSYIDATQLQTGMWPPKNTIHTIDVDGKAICAILKRNTKDDFYAYEYKTKAENPKDSMPVRVQNMMKAEELYKKAIQIDPNNETALLALTEIYMNRGNLDTANIFADMLLKVYPTYENGLNMKGWIGIQLFDKNKNQKALNESKEAFEKITKVNYKYVYGYYGLAMVYVRLNDIKNAIKALEDALKINPGFQQAAEMLNQLKSYSAKQGGI